MTIKDLKSLIENLPDDMIVVFSKDSEGTAFLKPKDHFVGAYRDGNVGYPELTSKLIKQGFNELHVVEGDEALVLYP